MHNCSGTGNQRHLPNVICFVVDMSIHGSDLVYNQHPLKVWESLGCENDHNMAHGIGKILEILVQLRSRLGMGL